MKWVLVAGALMLSGATRAAVPAPSYQLDTMADFAEHMSSGGPGSFVANGYALGILEMALYRKDVCLPAVPVDVVTAYGKALGEYFNAHPEAATEPAPKVLMEVAIKTFPCRSA